MPETLMTTCWRAKPPFSMSTFSEFLVISVVLIRVVFLSLQLFDAFLGGQQNAVWGVAHVLGGEVQQDDFGGVLTVSTQSVCSDAQQLPAQVSPEILCISSAQQSSLTSVVPTGAGSALFELPLPQVLVSTSAGTDGLQHEVFDFGLAGADDEQHELAGFGSTGFGGEQQELDAFDSRDSDG
jgi:hypothetical protein